MRAPARRCRQRRRRRHNLALAWWRRREACGCAGRTPLLRGARARVQSPRRLVCPSALAGSGRGPRRGDPFSSSRRAGRWRELRGCGGALAGPVRPRPTRPVSGRGRAAASCEGPKRRCAFPSRPHRGAASSVMESELRPARPRRLDVKPPRKEPWGRIGWRDHGGGLSRTHRPPLRSPRRRRRGRVRRGLFGAVALRTLHPRPSRREGGKACGDGGRSPRDPGYGAPAWGGVSTAPSLSPTHVGALERG